MGYTTEFRGVFKLDKQLTDKHAEYLRQFSETRRMGRKESAASLPDPIREAVGLPYGEEGEFYVGGDENRAYITDYNDPPASQPGLWCNWVPTEDNFGIEWDGTEKFYNYVEWIEYIIEKFLKPWGYALNGVVRWRGEDFDDNGKIVVTDNNVLCQPS